MKLIRVHGHRYTPKGIFVTLGGVQNVLVTDRPLSVIGDCNYVQTDKLTINADHALVRIGSRLIRVPLTDVFETSPITQYGRQVLLNPNCHAAITLIPNCQAAATFGGGGYNP